MVNDQMIPNNKTILIIIGPGFGHYHPIANLALALLENGNQVMMAGYFQKGSSLAMRINEDGFDFISLSGFAGGRSLGRGVNRFLLRILDRMTALSAKLPARDELPHLLSRFIFGFRSYIKPLLGIESVQLARFEQVISNKKPSLILVDGVAAESVNYLCARNEIPWVEYTTSPANVFEKDHPVYPVGLSPRLQKGERFVNLIMQWFFVKRISKRRRQILRFFPESLEQRENFSPRMNVCFSIPEIDDYQTNHQTSVQYVGCSLYKMNKIIINEQLPDGGIYVSFGSTGTKKDRSILSWLAKELAKYELPIYMQIVNPDILDEIKKCLPKATIERFHFIGKRSGPAYDLYKKSRLVISHGGYNTVLEGLYFGCPILLIPNIVADRMEVARRVVENGLGHCINYYNLDQDLFHTRVKDLLFNPEIVNRTAEVSLLLRDRNLYNNFQKEIFDLI